MLRFFFLLVFTPCCFNVFSLTSVIKGNNSEYAGKKLIAYTLSDYITNSEEIVASFEVDSSGNFNFLCETEEVALIYISLGAIKGYMYIEPGIDYTILLPPLAEKTIEQQLNPFYIEPETQLGLLEAKNKKGVIRNAELNYLIYYFDAVFRKNNNELIFATFNTSKNTKADSLVQELDTMFNKDSNEFFNKYKQYKIATLLFATDKKRNKVQYAGLYFANNPVLYRNPAFMELFHSIFDNCFLSFSNNADRIRKFDEAIYRQDYALLKNAFNFDQMILNDELKEFIILNEIFLELKKNNTPQHTLLGFIDSVYFQTSSFENRIVAENIRNSIIRLLPGFDPPAFLLTGDDGKKYSNSSFNKKYVYLIFCSIQSMASIREFPVLDSLQIKYQKYLKVVCVTVDKDFNEVVLFKERKNLKFLFLNLGNDQVLLKKYDVRAYPTCYLFDIDGKMLHSPAKLPSEGFEYKFYRVLKSANLL